MGSIKGYADWRPGAVGIKSYWTNAPDTVPTDAVEDDAITARKIDHDDTLGADGDQITVTNPFTAGDEAKLDRVGGEGMITEDSGTVTTAVNGSDTEAERRSGQTAVGSFTGDSELLRLHIDGDSGALTIILEGSESDYSGKVFRIGSRHLAFDDRTLAAEVNDTVQYDFFGDYSDDWLTAGTAQAWAILKAITEADILPDQSGHGGDVLHTDGDTPFWGAETITKFPIPLIPNRRYRNTAADSIRQPRLITALNEPPSQTLIGLEINAGNINGIRFYEPTNATPALRNRAALRLRATPEAGQPTITAFHIGTTIAGMVRHTVASSFVPGVQHVYLISGLTYSSVVVGTAYYILIEYSDGSYYPSSIRYDPGDWTASSQTILSGTPGAAAPWAENGDASTIPIPKMPTDIPDANLEHPAAIWARADNTDPIPPSKQTIPGLSPIIDDQAGPGVALTNSSQTVQTGYQAISPTFDMDDRENSSGVLLIRANLTLSNPTNNTIAFEQAANQDEAEDTRTARIVDWVTISEITATAAYDGSAQNGIILGSATIYQGSSELGELFIYVGRTTDNELQTYLRYVGGAGSQGFNIASSLTITFIHNDQGPAEIEFSNAQSLIGNADLNLPVPSTSGEFTAAYTPIFRYTNTDATPKSIQIAANLAAHGDWTPNGGGDRGYAFVRVRRHDASAGTTSTIIGDTGWYIRCLNVTGWNEGYPLTLVLNGTLDHNDYIQIEGRASRQGYDDGASASTATGNVVVENDASKIFLLES